jgi:ABC-2 type transport system permease protein
VFEPVERRRGLSLNLHATWARAYVRLAGLNREPSWMLHETVLPFIGACAYVYMYRALGAPPRFEGFALLGMGMATYWFAVLWGMAAQFYWEKEMGNLELYLQAPISRMSILAGMAIGSMVTSTIRFLTIVVAGAYFFGIHYDVTSWPTFIAAFVLTLTALYGLGMMAASLFFMYGRGAWQAFGLVQEPIFLAAGFFFPIRPVIGRWAFLVGAIVPLAFGLDAIRQVALPTAPDEVILPIRTEAALLAIMTVVFITAAHFSLAYMERIAKREGRLTLKWQ